MTKIELGDWKTYPTLMPKLAVGTRLFADKQEAAVNNLLALEARV